MTSRRSSLVLAAVLVATVLPVSGQKVYTKQDYAQAERWMPYNVNSLVHHTIGGVSYLPDGRVFYRDPGVGTTAYMIARSSEGDDGCGVRQCSAGGGADGGGEEESRGG